MITLTALKKRKLFRTSAIILLMLQFGLFGCIAEAGEAQFDFAGTENKEIMVNNVWVDVPLTQVFRDISIETGVTIATGPDISDPLVSLDAGTGKPLSECLRELIAGQGIFVYQKSKKLYIISSGDTTRPGTLEIAVSKRIYLKYITAKHIKSSLPKFLQQYVTSGERDNEIFIYAVPDILKRIIEIINKLDIQRRQVMLEVLVVDIWEDNSDELGIDWQYSGPHSAFSMADGMMGFTGLASYASVAASNLTQLNLTLRALIAKKRASIRSRPRVATLNGEKAKIDISLDEYYTIATDLYGSSLRTELEVIKSGVMLEMIPHIGDNGNITINVLTEVSDVASRRNQSHNSSTTGDDLPVIRRRRANTCVRVKEGDAIVIGGLIETQESSDDRHVPLLGNLPIVGGLFKSKKDSTVKKEVMIFITPRLMIDNQTALSRNYELIDETEEIGKLRDTAVMANAKQKIHSKNGEIQSPNKTYGSLEEQKQSDRSLHETDNTDLIYSDNIAEERRILQEIIALLDVENNYFYPITGMQSKNSRYEASLGAAGR